MSIHNIIPDEFIRFLLVLIFSLLIGLEQRRHHITENEDLLLEQTGHLPLSDF